MSQYFVQTVYFVYFSFFPFCLLIFLSFCLILFFLSVFFLFIFLFCLSFVHSPKLWLTDTSGQQFLYSSDKNLTLKNVRSCFQAYCWMDCLDLPADCGETDLICVNQDMLPCCTLEITEDCLSMDDSCEWQCGAM